jgi:hypothetical protein
MVAAGATDADIEQALPDLGRKVLGGMEDTDDKLRAQALALLKEQRDRKPDDDIVKRRAEVARLRDEEHLSWKKIGAAVMDGDGNKIGAETARKDYKRHHESPPPPLNYENRTN